MWALESVGMAPELVMIPRVVEGNIDLMNYDGVLIPGGFLDGDHFGAGRATGLKVHEQLRRFAEDHRPMFGICNGKQVLFEAGVFDDYVGEGRISGGAMIRNERLQFHSGWVTLLAEPGSPWTEGIDQAELKMPVAHGEGRWREPTGPIPSHLAVVLRYSNGGAPTEEFPHNPSGTPGGATGIVKGLVLGMMPHPERAMRKEVGSTDGRLIFEAFARLIRAA
jgi:phosphoribosylformylglycinamidine synthase